ncbi:MAG: hypothetical protein ACE5KE_04085 [Methanosarcinales archaeon]
MIDIAKFIENEIRSRSGTVKTFIFIEDENNILKELGEVINVFGVEYNIVPYESDLMLRDKLEDKKINGKYCIVSQKNSDYLYDFKERSYVIHIKPSTILNFIDTPYRYPVFIDRLGKYLPEYIDKIRELRRRYSETIGIDDCKKIMSSAILDLDFDKRDLGNLLKFIGSGKCKKQITILKEIDIFSYTTGFFSNINPSLQNIICTLFENPDLNSDFFCLFWTNRALYDLIGNNNGCYIANIKDLIGENRYNTFIDSTLSAQKQKNILRDLKALADELINADKDFSRGSIKEIEPIIKPKLRQKFREFDFPLIDIARKERIFKTSLLHVLNQMVNKVQEEAILMALSSHIFFEECKEDIDLVKNIIDFKEKTKQLQTKKIPETSDEWYQFHKNIISLMDIDILKMEENYGGIPNHNR